jgi:hypothetical protein
MTEIINEMGVMADNKNTFTIINKHSIKMLMVLILEKSLIKQILPLEYKLLNILR